jgi:hypothetical protein
MHINEDYIEDIELDQEEVSASEEGAEYLYVLKMKTAVIPKGRGLGFYYDNIVKMNKVIDRALAGFPLIESYDHDYEIKRLSEGKMGWGDEEQILSDGHRFFDDPDRINKHGRSMEYVIRINVRLETLSQIRQFLVFMWNVLLKAIDASFKAQTSAQQVALEKDDSYILITSMMANVWI